MLDLEIKDRPFPRSCTDLFLPFRMYEQRLLVRNTVATNNALHSRITFHQFTLPTSRPPLNMSNPFDKLASHQAPGPSSPVQTSPVQSRDPRTLRSPSNSLTYLTQFFAPTTSKAFARAFAQDLADTVVRRFSQHFTRAIARSSTQAI